MSDSKQEQSSFKTDLKNIMREIRKPLWQAISNLDDANEQLSREAATYLHVHYISKKQEELKKSSFFSPKNLKEANVKQFDGFLERFSKYSNGLTFFLNTPEDIRRAEKYFEVLEQLNSCDEFDKLTALVGSLRETKNTTADLFLKHELELRIIPSIEDIIRRSKSQRNSLAHRIHNVESQLQKFLFNKLKESPLPILQKMYARYSKEQKRIELVNFEKSIMNDIENAELRNKSNLKDLNNIKERINNRKELLAEKDPKDHNGFSLSVDDRIKRDRRLIDELQRLPWEEERCKWKIKSDEARLASEIQSKKIELEAMKKSFASSDDDELMQIEYVDLSNFEEITRFLDQNLSKEEKDKTLKELCSEFKLPTIETLRSAAAREQSMLKAREQSSASTAPNKPDIDSIKSTTSISYRDSNVAAAGFFGPARSTINSQPGFTQIIPVKKVEKFESREPSTTPTNNG